MAWRCTGASNAELIANLRSHKLISLESVADAMKKVDRAHYTLGPRGAYEDSPQYIGHGATISAPHMHAMAAEHLVGDANPSPFIFPGARVLDVGSGSGYFTAVLHHLVSSPNKPGAVVGIDHIPALVDFAVENLKKDGLGPALASGAITLVAGDGRQGLLSPSPFAPQTDSLMMVNAGYARGGPYSAIHVGAAAPAVPAALVEQLARPGRMFVPVGPDGGAQVVMQVDKDADGAVTETRLMGVRYVPLTDRAG
ncbi:hypothetical protein HWV62_35073 [Athelia sp. TMB]|nr:hypothetical protein HWV62_35073 [Athelia sp. TMB]